MNEAAMLDSLLGFIQDRITIKDTEGVYMRVNKVKSEALNLKDPKDAIGLTDASFFGEEHFKKALAEEKELLQSESFIMNKEEQIKHQDGTVRWGATSRIPFRNSRGEMIGVLIITKDITDQKILYGKLESQTAVLLELSDRYPIICYELNFNGTIDKIYGHGLELLKLKTDDLEGQNISSVFKELKNKLRLGYLKKQVDIEYEYKNQDTLFKISHRISKNSSTGIIYGCAEVNKISK
jgi:PAS domain S-box-containing protein